MYLSEKSRSIDLYKNGGGEMMIRVAGNGRLPPEQHQEHQQMIQAESSGDNREVRARKKRAEAWVQEETRSLISFRKELDGLFNTTKSNKHLWKQISAKMREKGFNRSPPMCTEKWRNLLKEFKKAKHHQNKGSASAKISYYKELDELLKDRNKNSTNKSPTTSKVDSFQQFSDRGLEDASIPLGSAEASGRPTINLDGHLDHDRHSLAITAADAVAANGVPPWNWRDTSANGGDNHASYGGRVISIKWGEYTKKIGIDGTAEAIKDVINSAFGLRTRTFWLEDEDEVVRTLDRDMPLGTYTLHLDEGVTIKICTCDSTDHIVHTEEMTLYGAEDFRDLLTRRGWTRLRDLNVVYRSVQTLNDLRPGGMYQGLR